MQDEKLNKEFRIYKVQQLLHDKNDYNALFSDRWNKVGTNTNGVKTFDYFKDFDLLLAYGFDFENGTWFEFVGYLEKLMYEDNALSKRISYRGISMEDFANDKNSAKRQMEKQKKSYLTLKQKFKIKLNKQEQKVQTEEGMQNMYNFLKANAIVNEKKDK
jgi:hypothetical protein